MESVSEWQGVVSDIRKTGNNFSQVFVKLKQIKPEFGEWEQCNCRVLAYLNTKGKDEILAIGSLIIARSKFQGIEANKNPKEFNPRKYYENKGIYHLTFAFDYQKVGNQASLKTEFKKLADFLKMNFRNNGVSGKEFSVLEAIYFGDKSRLERDLKQAYAGVGAMHILAVSGLHVGIIYLIIKWLLSLVPFFKRRKHLISSFILLILWIYAALVGFSPSVQRASIMFSFLAIANMLKRNTSIYNSIAASALVLLLIKPNLIFDIGFQLSYSAVIGIVALHPFLLKIHQSKNWFLNKALDIIYVSIAAQIATLPLTLYYFHQFPTYFLFTNLFVIPIAFLIVGLSVICSLLFLLFDNDFLLVTVLNLGIKLLNKGVVLLDSLPYSTIGDIWIEPLSVVILFLVIGLIFIHFTHYHPKYLLSSLFLLLLFCSIEFVMDWKNYKKIQLTAYSFKDRTVISIKCGMEAKLLSDDSLSGYQNTTVRNHLKSMSVHEISYTKDTSMRKWAKERAFKVEF